jgi:hypothetical protein
MNLFDPAMLARKERDRAVDVIRQRFGFDAVKIPDKD